jgi:hypothetical protein
VVKYWGRESPLPVIVRLNTSPMKNVTNLRKSIIYLQKACMDNPDNELHQALHILSLYDKEGSLKKRLEKIASTYHDRAVLSQISGFFSDKKFKCPLCFNDASTLTSIEPDDKNNKYLSICTDCYMETHNIWKAKTPNKICPI